MEFKFTCGIYFFTQARKDSHIYMAVFSLFYKLKSAGDSMQSLISLIAYLLYPATV